MEWLLVIGNPTSVAQGGVLLPNPTRWLYPTPVHKYWLMKWYGTAAPTTIFICQSKGLGSHEDEAPYPLLQHFDNTAAAASALLLPLPKAPHACAAPHIPAKEACSCQHPKINCFIQATHGSLCWFLIRSYHRDLCVGRDGAREREREKERESYAEKGGDPFLRMWSHSHPAQHST